jgi:hypothetical protein
MSIGGTVPATPWTRNEVKRIGNREKEDLIAALEETRDEIAG